MTKKPLSIYIHYPFCKSKCPYCDFNSHVRDQVNYGAFLKAYENEIDFFADKLSNRKVTTIFFGGGTPSLMPTSLVEGILTKISQRFSLDENCEISLEANPTSFEAKKFKDFRSLGINRLSIGIQALNDEDLKFLGRTHSGDEAIATIKEAQNIFENFSFDLIYARPKQTLKDWENELKIALDFNTKHLSLYQLTIEKGTKFFSDFKDKKFEMPSEELSAEFYERTNEIVEKNGFELYEISNYAKPGFVCKHNLTYWQGLDYIGLGAGAHSRVFLDGDKNRSAIMMIHEPNSWLKKAEEKVGIQTISQTTSDELLEEIILSGLRLKDGIRNEVFKNLFSKNITEIFDLKKLKKLIEENFIEISDERILITKKGRILSNAIITKVCESVLNERNL